jgi:signal transduction histidine kinase
MLGVLERHGDEAVYPIIAPVRSNGEVLGYLVERRQIAGSEESGAQIRELIGSDARLLIGNTVGDVWTDMRGPVDAPPVPVGSQTDLLDYTATTGEAVFARATPVTLTPWLLVVEFPRTVVLTTARRFLASSAVLSLLFVVAGAGTGWALTRRIVVPLGRLTDAAESIAAGKQAERIASDRNDEVGRLAASFDTMVERVEEGRLQLEALVAERTAELEATNRELEAFSYSVSHDLRAPLRTVDGFAAVLTEDHAAQLTPEAQRSIAMIRAGAQQMGHLIDDLLTLSRLGRYPITLAHVDMHELARSVADEARSSANGSAEIIVHPLPPALGERLLLRQILFNLVHNGLKFSRHRDVPRVEIGFTNGEGEVIYHVKDNGAGFDMRYASKLFGVFQRLHGSDEFEGTGVGLAIVHRLVQRHGGRIWAEAEVDRGATFYFALRSSE